VLLLALVAAARFVDNGRYKEGSQSMQSTRSSRRVVIFWLLALALPVLVLWFALPPLWAKVERALRPEVIAWVAMHMPPEEKAKIQQAVSSIGSGMFRIVPDPLVGRVGRSHFEVVEKQAVVSMNNAGMRSRSDYVAKPDDVFRIVCLGDSFVFGEAGLEEDRFCKQIEDFYRERQISVGGKRIETLAIGLGSWTARQEAAYLTSRLDDYAPDVVLVLTCQKDISDSFGVTENGTLTTSYSSDQRARGSAIFKNDAGMAFGGGTYSALSTDLCHECQHYWQEAFADVGRLVDVQQQRQGKILLSVLEHPARHAGYFMQLFKQYARETGAPYMLTSFVAGQESFLPHDGHPSRFGHKILATHYIRAMSQLGWIVVPDAVLPFEPRMHPENMNPDPDLQDLALHQQKFIDEHIPPTLDFLHLDLERTSAFLGGIFPEHDGELVSEQGPWASIRAGFLLQKPATEGDAKLLLRLQLPAKSVLFPMELSIKVNGQLLAKPVFTEASAQGFEDIELNVPRSLLIQYPAVEILLETPRYFSGIEDHRMKSYRLLSATVR
jgi:hypothetical protein